MRAGMGAMLSLVVLSCSAPSKAPEPPERAAPAPSTVESATPPSASPAVAVPITLFTMSKDPYSVPVVEQLIDLARAHGAGVSIRVEFVGSRGPDGELRTMHGPTELKGDLLEVCAQKHPEKLLGFIACENARDKDFSDWRPCAKEVGLPELELSACESGPERRALLAASFDVAASEAVTAAPTIVIGGDRFTGPRRRRALSRAICAKVTGPAPTVCTNVPVLPQVRFSILSDPRCGTDCKPVDKLEKSVVDLIENPSAASRLEYGSAEGKALFARIAPSRLPAVVFDDTLDGAPDDRAILERHLRAAGPLRVMEVGEWDPVCSDPGGCKLETCSLTAVCRKETPKTLELFIMSKCPFANKALLSLKEVFANFDRNHAKVDLSISYIGKGDRKAGFTSMHGPAEVEEDLRHVCAIKHYPQNRKFMEYLTCRAADLKSDDWKACTGRATGIDAKVLQTCAEGDEGRELLEKSFARSKASARRASPSWFVNGNHTFLGYDAETIKNRICDRNRLPGCDATLSGVKGREASSSSGPE